MKQGRAICVTGGAGYIGSHVCKALAARGYVPVTVDNLSTGAPENVRWGPLCNLDLRDTDALRRALRDHGCRTILHFAASAYVGKSMTDPAKYYDNNVIGMHSLLNAARQSGVETLILSSSCATYGTPVFLPVTETGDQRPINPYGRSKLMCEMMLKDIAEQAGISYGILRYFNVAGADPEGHLRERHNPETHLIPLALMTAAGKRPEMQIFGNDYETVDGTCIRDYVHVSDLAKGHLQALDYLDRGHLNVTVNLGSGTGYSIIEVLQMVRKVTGRDLPVRFLPRRPGDPPTLVADTKLARRVLGFRAPRSGLATIVADAARSFGMEQANVFHS